MLCHLALVWCKTMAYVYRWNLKSRANDTTNSKFLLPLLYADVFHATGGIVWVNLLNRFKVLRPIPKGFFSICALFFWFIEHSYQEKLRDQARRRFGNHLVHESMCWKGATSCSGFPGKDERWGRLRDSKQYEKPLLRSSPHTGRDLGRGFFICCNIYCKSWNKFRMTWN